MNKKIIISYILTVIHTGLFAQFDGIVGSEGCKAVHCNDALIIEWATECKVIRGYQDIALPEKGYASYGTDTNAIGKVNDSITTDAVSLGDSGIAILTFQTPISNGDGYDFAVFENSFDDSFLELAFVEVSSDGIHYFRFPATSNTPVDKQVGGFGKVDATLINNLAGKYRVGWGTPFDLEELPDNIHLDKHNILYVKIIDVVGTINPDHATYDANGNIVNDPYPTAFASSGFDLTGVGVINNQTNTSNNTFVNEYDELFVSVYPNPCRNFVYIHANACRLSVYNSLGQKLKEQYLTENHSQIDMNNYPKGIYFIHLQNNHTTKYFKLIKQ
ncbi:MAG: T9SS type A sorting domain-containing protein [Bacteroidales bacterium]|jgi:hypothetical protein|nr:T9SS type A sorting domain-containing protein [Bacteroidales bacterium]